MKYIGKSSEDEMISVFLLSEIHSTRFRNDLLKIVHQCETSESVILRPDVQSKEENELRKTILREYRGYEKNIELFENFPAPVMWEKVTMDVDDLYRVKLLNGPYWRNLSDQTRLGKVSVKNIKTNKTNVRIVDAAGALAKGETFPPLIVVSTRKGEDIVVLEGSLRLIAYLMEPKNVPKEVEAIIGYSPDFIKWNLY